MRHLTIALAAVLWAALPLTPSLQAEDAAPAPAAKPAAPTPPTADEIAAAGQWKGAVIHIEGRGDITVDLFPATSPMTVANFAKLAQAKFYDGCTFHRVEPGFVIQGGDPNTKPGGVGSPGTGGPGYKIPGEVNPQKHLPGTLAMADSGPNTAGSQFYLTQDATPFLDGRYTTFGRVRTGKDLQIVRSVRKGDRFTVTLITAETAAAPSVGTATPAAATEPAPAK